MEKVSSNQAKFSTCLTTASGRNQAPQRNCMTHQRKQLPNIPQLYSDAWPEGPKGFFEILIRFKVHIVAMSADIAKHISTVSPRQKITTFLLTTVERVTVFLKHYLETRNTYGVASAGFHALSPSHCQLRQLSPLSPLRSACMSTTC